MRDIPVLDAAQAAQWDEHARLSARIPSRVLMESAGRAVAAVLASRYPAALRDGVLVAAGHGNNGGDGWVAARALAALGVTVRAVEVDRQRAPDCEANRRLALAEGVELVTGNWPPAGVVVDALLGTGATGAPGGPIGELAARVASHLGPIVAVDGPTGLDLTTGEAAGPVRATLTVTFGGARRGHLLQRDWCGAVVVADIGFPLPDPSWPVLVTERWAADRLPGFTPAMHKGSRGRVLVVGGAAGMAGAALHAASGAFAAGAGLVKLAGAPETVRAAQASLPDALTLETALGPEVEAPLREALAWADAVVVGPGLGRDESRAPFVAGVLDGCEAPVVIDADGLQTGLATLGTGGAPRVLTPHPGEFAAAFPDLAETVARDRFAAAEQAAAMLGYETEGASAVLLKGVPTVIASAGAPTGVSATGNPSLATGGSGDLLAGFIGAFLARGQSPRDAAALGAFVLGRGAEIASAQHTVRATRPADVLASLPELWRRLEEPPAAAPPVLLVLEPPALV